MKRLNSFKRISFYILIALLLSTIAYLNYRFEYPFQSIVSNNLWKRENIELKDYQLKKNVLISTSQDPYIVYYPKRTVKTLGFTIDIELKNNLDNYAQVKVIYGDDEILSSDYVLLKNGKNNIYLNSINSLTDIKYYRFDLTTENKSEMTINSIEINSLSILFEYCLRFLYVSLYIALAIIYFVKSVFSLNTSKRNTLTDITLIVTLLLFSVLAYLTYDYDYDYEKIFVVIASICFLGLYYSHKKQSTKYYPLFFSILSFCAIQLLISQLHIRYDMFLWIVNILIACSFHYFFYGLFNSKYFRFLTPFFVLLILGIINHYYYLYRDKAINLLDFLSTKTAFTVIQHYGYPLDLYVITSIAFFILLFIITIITKLKTNNLSLKRRFIICLSSVAVFFSIVFYPKKVDYWSINYEVRKSGYLYSFVKYAYKTLNKPTPKDYNVASVREDLNKYYKEDTNHDDDAKNIIVIMNESFTNLQDIYGFETDIDPVLYIRSLSGGNVKKGYAISNVFGGGTATSEFEMLFGTSMCFLSLDSQPYVQYINKNKQSLSSQLKEKGYTTIAYHPYYGDNYRRSTVYPLIGFDEFISIENDLKYDDCLGGFITDYSDFNEIIDIYERNKDDKLFIFNVTIQNHGPFGDRDFDYDIHATTDGIRSDSLDEYLSLIRYSDRSFEYLIDYFSEIEDKTIILMFGDHQPSLDSETYNTIKSKSNLNEAEIYIGDNYLSNIVPFVIWANYDLSDDTYALTSLNYLKSILLKEANMLEDGYDIYSYNCYKKYPVISVKGIIDSSRNSLTTESLGNIEELLDYNKYSYYYLFDD